MGEGLPDCHSDGILDKQGSEVMFTQQIHHVLHVMSNRRYMGKRKREASLDVASTFTLFCSLSVRHSSHPLLFLAMGEVQ